MFAQLLERPRQKSALTLTAMDGIGSSSCTSVSWARWKQKYCVKQEHLSVQTDVSNTPSAGVSEQISSCELCRLAIPFRRHLWLQSTHRCLSNQRVKKPHKGSLITQNQNKHKRSHCRIRLLNLASFPSKRRRRSNWMNHQMNTHRHFVQLVWHDSDERYILVRFGTWHRHYKTACTHSSQSKLHVACRSTEIVLFTDFPLRTFVLKKSCFFLLYIFLLPRLVTHSNIVVRNLALTRTEIELSEVKATSRSQRKWTWQISVTVISYHTTLWRSQQNLLFSLDACSQTEHHRTSRKTVRGGCERTQVYRSTIQALNEKSAFVWEPTLTWQIHESKN